MSSEAIPSHDEVLTFSNSMLSIKSQIDELNSKLGNLSNNLDSDNIEVKYGLSYYESKQNLFIIYLTELISYMLSKVNAVHSIDDSPVVQNLIKIKALIEKEKNIDLKLQPQIKRLLALAERGATEEEANYKPRLIEENEEEEESDSEIEKQKKQIMYQVNQNLIEFYETTDENKKRKKQLERDKQRIRNSETIKELREEMSDAPKMINTYDSHVDKYKKEIEEYEDDHFVNLRLSNRERKKLERKDRAENELYNIDKEFSRVNNILNDNEDEDARREEKNKFIQRKREMKKIEKGMFNKKRKFNNKH